MPKKKTYEEVKSNIEKISNGNCELLSKEYKNCSTKLLFKCKCGRTFERTYSKFIVNKPMCPECSIDNSPRHLPLDDSYVKEQIEKFGCKWIGGKYENIYSKLIIKCECGNIFVKDYNHFRRGQHRCPQCGKEIIRQKKFKYDLDSARKIIENRGYTMLDDEYIDCMTPINVMCDKGHKFTIKLSHLLTGHSGCKQCANDNLKGENHYNYKGGESEVLDYFRKNIKFWKVEVMKKYKNRCALTNSKDDCVIHHIKSFNTIIKESCEELNIPLERKIKDYDSETFEKLKEKVFSKHTVDNGILLQRKVHNKFHAIYGKGNNTKEQFQDFVDKYYKGKIKI